MSTLLELKQNLVELDSRLQKVIVKKDLPSLKLKLTQLQTQSQSANFWSEQQAAQNTMQQIGDIQKEIEFVESLTTKMTETLELVSETDETDSELMQMVESEVKSLQKDIDKLELLTFLSGKFDANNAIVKIYAGQGGTEANDWADMLFRMYTRYFNTQGWKVTVIEKIDGNEAGIQSVTLVVSGRYAYGYLKNEKGTHRLVRNSPFNSAGLRQTSFANVEVLPQIEEDIDIELKDEEIEFSAVRSSGAGGQNVNKVATKVRLTHKPSGISVESSVHKTQSQNRKEAENLLKARLFELQEEKRQQEMGAIKGEHKKASWGNQIRNYVFSPYKLVKDVRTGIETSNTDAVMDGEIQEFIDAGVRL